VTFEAVLGPVADVLSAGLTDMVARIYEARVEERREAARLAHAERSDRSQRLHEIQTMVLRAAIDEQRAQNEHRRGLDAGAHRARQLLEFRSELRRLESLERDSPFGLDARDVRERVYGRTRGGKLPAYIPCPFYGHVGPGADGFQIALRRPSIDTDWSGDVARLSGLVQRSLHRADADEVAIRSVLADFPVILVYGDVQANRRVWVTVATWNLTADHPPTIDQRNEVDLQIPEASVVNLPGLPIPIAGTADADDALLALEDDVSRLVWLYVGLFAEWFHVARGRRSPERHRHMPHPELRKIAAIGSAAMLDIAAESGRRSVYSALAEQARVFIDVGLRDRAAELLRAAVPALRPTGTGEPSDLLATFDSLITTATRLGDHDLVEEFERLAIQAVVPLAETEGH
jgi:hypothetical protein